MEILTCESYALFTPMEFSIMVNTFKSGRSTAYIEGIHVNFPNNIVFLSLEVDFVLANSTNPDEMLYYAAFHLGLYCMPKYQFRDSSL